MMTPRQPSSSRVTPKWGRGRDRDLGLLGGRGRHVGRGRGLRRAQPEVAPAGREWQRSALAGRISRRRAPHLPARAARPSTHRGSLLVDRAPRTRASGRLDGVHDLGARSARTDVVGIAERPPGRARAANRRAVLGYPPSDLHGLLGMLLGSVLLNGLGASLALLVVGTVVLATRIPIEERLMSKTFPNEYARYRKRVPRLVPGLRLLRRSH